MRKGGSPENKNSDRPELGDRIRKDEPGKAHSRGKINNGRDVEDTLCANVLSAAGQHHDESSLVEEGFSFHLTAYSPLGMESGQEQKRRP